MQAAGIQAGPTESSSQFCIRLFQQGLGRGRALGFLGCLLASPPGWVRRGATVHHLLTLADVQVLYLAATEQQR